MTWTRGILITMLIFNCKINEQWRVKFFLEIYNLTRTWSYLLRYRWGVLLYREDSWALWLGYNYIEPVIINYHHKHVFSFCYDFSVNIIIMFSWSANGQTRNDCKLVTKNRGNFFVYFINPIKFLCELKLKILIPQLYNITYNPILMLYDAMLIETSHSVDIDGVANELEMYDIFTLFVGTLFVM